MKIFRQCDFFKYLTHILTLIFLFMLFIMPFKIGQFTPYAKIFPAIELMIIFQLIVNKLVKNWQLLIIGIFLDQLYQTILGVTSISLIVLNISVQHFSNKFSLRNYSLNILIFYLYFSLMMAMKLLILLPKTNNYFEFNPVIFYYFTTIFSYPLVIILLQKPINILSNYESQ